MGGVGGEAANLNRVCFPRTPWQPMMSSASENTPFLMVQRLELYCKSCTFESHPKPKKPLGAPNKSIKA